MSESKSVTVSDAVKLKSGLERDLLEKIRAFEDATGTRCDNFTVVRFGTMSSEHAKAAGVRCDVVLNTD